MSLLAHTTYAARGLEAQRRNLDKQIQAEAREAKRIQRATGCTWARALMLAAALVATGAQAEVNLRCTGTVHAAGVDTKETIYATWYPERNRLDVFYTSFTNFKKHPTVAGDYSEDDDHRYAGINQLSGQILVLRNRNAEEKLQVSFSGTCERAIKKF